ncbi:hypothetical protein ANCDUO_17219 [Ancylostoma duodenale]|uniref:Uncharacterized protein n=1 Tax=Ancylostoma duodenale TaxID=51022 RepID=A0A0C2C8L1_9BILA|nr:hypothetical protein ANCDUO_17219 [Ancylostoma duodenale]
MEDAYPDIFVLNKNIALVLKCQQFVEMAAEIARQDALAKPVAITSSNGQSMPSSAITPRCRNLQNSCLDSSNFMQTFPATHSYPANPHKRTYVDSQAEDIEAPPARRTPPFADDDANVPVDVQMEEEPCSSSAVLASTRNGQSAEDVKNGAGSADGGSIDDGLIIGADGDTTIIEEENTEDEEGGLFKMALHNSRWNDFLFTDVEVEDGIRREEEAAACAVE